MHARLHSAGGRVDLDHTSFTEWALTQCVSKSRVSWLKSPLSRASRSSRQTTTLATSSASTSAISSRVAGRSSVLPDTPSSLRNLTSCQPGGPRPRPVCGCCVTGVAPLVVTGQRERAGGYPINATTTSQGSGSAKKAGCGPATRSETSAMNVPPGTLSPPVSNR